MSIEKFDVVTFEKEELPAQFTMISNAVLQNYTKESLSIWVHLVSLPPQWEVNRAYLMRKFNLGRDKLNRYIKELIDHKLMSYKRVRSPDGKICSLTIVVKNGLEYAKELKIHPMDLATTLKTRIVDEPTTLKSHNTEKPGSGKSAAYKDTLLIKEREKQEREPVPVDNFVAKALAKAPVQDKQPQKPSLYSFEPTSLALEAAAAKGLDVPKLKAKFIRHYSGEGEFARNWPELFHNWVEREKIDKPVGRPSQESGFADVTKQSNSFGAAPTETPEESQRKWEERMREYGYDWSGQKQGARHCA